MLEMPKANKHIFSVCRSSPFFLSNFLDMYSNKLRIKATIEPKPRKVLYPLAGAQRTAPRQLNRPGGQWISVGEEQFSITDCDVGCAVSKVTTIMKIRGIRGSRIDIAIAIFLVLFIQSACD